MFYSSHPFRVPTAKKRAPLLHCVVFPISCFSVGWEEDAGLVAAKAVFHSCLRRLGQTSWRIMAAALLAGRHWRGRNDWSSCLTLNTTMTQGPGRQPATGEAERVCVCVCVQYMCMHE